MNKLLSHIRTLHTHIRDAVVTSCENNAVEELSHVAADDTDGDTIYAVDRVSEEILIDFFARYVAPDWPLVLIAEGLSTGQVVLPTGIDPSAALIRVIVDPIDGTRGLMYQKRSAWILTGVAPNRGPKTDLRDIELAVQTEIPLVKQHLSDMLWTTAGGEVHALRYNRLTATSQPITLHPSRASSVAHGFAMISRFFPGAREELAAIDDAVIQAVLGPPQPNKAQCFEDQYISSAGQLYELIAGHDRFVADLRPLLKTRGLEECAIKTLPQYPRSQASTQGICCHPYDLATILIAQQAGVIITGPTGAPLDAPLNTTSDVGWIGYANTAIQAQIEAVLLNELRTRRLIN